MTDTSEKHMLRFGCPECDKRLVVDPSLAGKEGPCPSCGEVIIAPPIAATTRLVAKAGAPVAIKPREIGRKGAGMASEPSSVSAAESTTQDRRRGRKRSGIVAPGHGNAADAGADISVAIPAANKGAISGSRKISADTSVSQKSAQANDVKTLMLMVLVTCIVVCIALGVYYYMTIVE